MKPESYFAWKEKPTSIIAPDWRAPTMESRRRRGIMGALSALADRFRSTDTQ
jgi:hypothetical protein